MRNRWVSREHDGIPTDPVEFCKDVLAFTPTRYQEQFLKDKNQFVSLRWSRQSGKSFIVSARLMWEAVVNNGTHIAIVAPSYRQSRLVLRKITDFLIRVPKQLISTVEKTRIVFRNGSTIEALPNNPLTIRGPTLNLVYCDEMNFIRDDVELYDAILFTLATTNGSFIASSTPGSRDGLFYKICFAPEYLDFSRSHVSWRDAVEPNGPLKNSILDRVRRQLESNPWRWTREMEAEFAEDENAFFPLSLVTGCVDGQLEYITFDAKISDRLIYLGVDFGKHRDHSVVAAINYDNESRKASLIHIHRFALETEYASVIGYVKALVSRWQKTRQVTTDVTGVGDFITEEMKRAGIPQTVGVQLTIPSKTDILGNLKEMMQSGRLSVPYDSELISEITSQRFELMKSGQVQFSHPEDSHDDRLWALALACYGTRMIGPVPTYHPVAAVNTSPRPGNLMPNLPRKLWKK